MRFLADENVATSVVAALRSAGHDVFDVNVLRHLLAFLQDEELVEKLKKPIIAILTENTAIFQHF